MLDFDLYIITILLIPYVVMLCAGLYLKVSIKKIFILSILYLYFCAVISKTLFPIPIDKNVIEIYKNVHLGNNLIPMKTILNFIQISYFKVALTNLGGNLLLLFPLGFYISIVWKSINTFLKAALLGFSVSLIIELIQLTISQFLGFSYKSFDVDDIMLNTLGCIFGYSLFIFSLPILVKLNLHRHVINEA